MKHKVMIVDAGGRAAALAAKYLESKLVSAVVVVPGNDLIAYMHKKAKIYPNVKVTDTSQITKIALEEKVDLVDVAQDDAVAAGVVDALVASDIKVLGPTKLAGQIEWDKSWSKNFMKKIKIPSAAYIICYSQKEGLSYIKKQKDASWFIKASGLAAGKGALFAKNNKDAQEKIKQMQNFGKAGETFVIEKCLFGEEFSAFALCDGQTFQILGYAQDHKTVFENNEGPNTGGMGCSSPPMAITKDIEKQTAVIFKKAVSGLQNIKRPYVGILYLGGIIDKNRRVLTIEFNARWGDPEAQVVIPAVKNDFYTLATAAVGKKIKSVKIKKDNKYRIAITCASRGYPQDYSKVGGKQIFGLKIINSQVKILGAGVRVAGNKYFARGGRLFYVLAEGKNILEARKYAYEAIAQIFIEGNNMHTRGDIGYRDLERFYKK